MHPIDDDDKPIFVGRCNLGAITLHLPMILQKSRVENKDFYEVLDYYLEMIRNLHKRTYEYLGEKKASTNPLAWMQGGFLGGHLDKNDKIRPLLAPMTMSFGITALNELQELYNGKSLVEDSDFAYEVMSYINEYVDRIKEEDGILYAIYGTPAESLCFDGDTIVQAYGGDKKISELKVGDLVYSYNEESKKIELKPVLAAEQTQKNAVTVTVTFDNGQKVVCTPNHPFAKRKMLQTSDGTFVKEVISYTEARDLKEGDRIRSNYININSDGHYICTTDQYVHDIVAEYFYGMKPAGYVTHHKDENKLNNLKENLEYKKDSDHRRLHMSKKFKECAFTSETSSGESNSFFGKHHTEEAKELNRQKHLGSNNVSSKPIVQLDMFGNLLNAFSSIGEAMRVTGLKNLSYALNGRYTSKTNKHEYKGSQWYFAEDYEVIARNHKVVSVEYNSELIPVYNITVADNHNYYVGGKDGILVHNCGTQVEQFRKKYGVIKNVSDRPYTTNSFHCHVTEKISPIEKQDKEERFWNLFNGGKIQYVRYPLGYNRDAIKTLVRRAMDKGFYEGVNLDLCYCEDCGHQQVEMKKCPVCGSENITEIDRMNGYLGYTRIKGDTRFNPAKNAEINDRVSM